MSAPTVPCKAHVRYSAVCPGCIAATEQEARELTEWHERHARAQIEHAEETKHDA